MSNSYAKYSGIGGGGSGGSPTIGGPVVGGLDGAVLFVHPSGVLAQDPTNFNFNDSTFALSITGNLSAATFNGYTPENVANKGAPNGYAPLDGAAKVPYANLPSALMTYRGAWNPITNTPTLTNGTGLTGDTYRASVNGTSTSPIADTWFAGDFIIYNGTIWQRSPLADGVISVNGLSGAVTLTQGNLTDAGTDGITVTNGTNAVWGTGTSLSQHVADTTHNGYLSSTDWNTFNNKQPAGSYATIALNNLALTAVNANINPGITATINLGAFNLCYNQVSSTDFLVSSGSVGVGHLGQNQSLPDGNTAGLSLYGNGSNNIGIFTQASGSTTPAIYLETGNTIGGANNTGPIILRTGTVATGTRGQIKFQDGSEGTSGYIWTSTDTVGSGHWAVAPTSGINQLTGDATAGPGSGSQVLTLATVNANVGSFGSSTSIPNFTVNAKGLLTAAGSNVVIAPAGTLSGTTLNATVVTSSLTSLGAQSQALNMNSHLINNVTNPVSTQDAATKNYVDNITTLNSLSLPGAQVTGNISGNAANVTGIVAIANGGTGQTSASAAFNALNPMTTTGDLIYESATNVASRLPIGTAGQVLTVNSGIPSWQPAPGTVSAFFASSQVTTDSSAITGTSFSTFSNSPALTFTPTITGTYKVYCSIPTDQQNQGVQGVTKIFNTSGSGTLLYESQCNTFSQSGGAVIDSSFVQSVYTLTSGTSYTFDIQGKNLTTGSILATGSNSPFYMFAELEIANTASNPSANYYNGYFPGGAGSWSTTSTSFVDLTVGTAPGTLTQLQKAGFPTINPATSNLPGISFTANRTGTIRVTCSFPYEISSAGGTVSASQLFETNSSTVLGYAEAYSHNVADGVGGQLIVIGYFSVTTGSPYEFKIQAKTSSGTFFVGEAATSIASQMNFLMEYVS